MYLNNCGLLLYLVLLSALSTVGQDCLIYDQSCTDDNSCCGGCCLDGTCKDTYLDCWPFPVEDPCSNRHCPEDQICYTYKPLGCKGCGPLVECRTMILPRGIKIDKSLHHFHSLSNSVLSNNASLLNWRAFFIVGLYLFYRIN